MMVTIFLNRNYKQEQWKALLLQASTHLQMTLTFVIKRVYPLIKILLSIQDQNVTDAHSGWLKECQSVTIFPSQNIAKQ